MKTLLTKYWPSALGIVFLVLLALLCWKAPIIGYFFIGHWYISLFSQTFFHHRYGAHKMFTMSKIWEKIFYVFTYIAQGSSYLNPKAYAILHRMHHAYSDKENDPHSPHIHPPIFPLMKRTKLVYDEMKTDETNQFNKNDYPQWKFIDTIGSNWVSRVSWGILYTIVYIAFVPSGMWYLYLLLPIHYLMSPVHGAIVNWWGHWYGYQNFNNGDRSTNTFVWDIVMLGECYQNNHHMYSSHVNFAWKSWEFDPTYYLIQPLKWLGIIKMNFKN